MGEVNCSDNDSNNNDIIIIIISLLLLLLVLFYYRYLNHVHLRILSSAYALISTV